MTYDKTTCPHCGFESEDDELCRACGELSQKNTPDRKISWLEKLEISMRSWPILSKKNYSGLNDTYSTDKQLDMDTDPSWSTLSSNIYHERRFK